jgi:hypothetical protein
MTALDQATSDGRWITPSVSYVEPKRLFCALSGRPIARRYWQQTIDGKTLNFCDPEHAQLYIDYWLPTYGSPEPPSE